MTAASSRSYSRRKSSDLPLMTQSPMPITASVSFWYKPFRSRFTSVSILRVSFSEIYGRTATRTKIYKAINKANVQSKKPSAITAAA
ncbi:hypothetical protein D3C73_1464080 [compost metagenome]